MREVRLWWLIKEKREARKDGRVPRKAETSHDQEIHRNAEEKAGGSACNTIIFPGIRGEPESALRACTGKDGTKGKMAAGEGGGTTGLKRKKGQRGGKLKTQLG